MMTDIIELEIAIKRARISKKELANRLNISLQTLYNKLNNSVEFKASEVLKICKILELSNADRERIFFANDVDN